MDLKKPKGSLRIEWASLSAFLTNSIMMLLSWKSSGYLSKSVYHVKIPFLMRPVNNQRASSTSIPDWTAGHIAMESVSGAGGAQVKWWLSRSKTRIENIRFEK